MSQEFTKFMINPTGNASRNLNKSITYVQDRSFDFRSDCAQGDHDKAYEISQEAFEHLDYIHSEFLRHRDARSGNKTVWDGSRLKSALDAPVGLITYDISESNQSWFKLLPPGSGAFPPGHKPVVLNLDPALQKLKHRSPTILNYLVPEEGGHIVYIFTMKGIKQPNSISQIDMDQFCSACRKAASYV